MFFSSISVLVGSAGHANYCAANAVLDAVAMVEGEQGLPTLAIDWGAWTSVGAHLDGNHEHWEILLRSINAGCFMSEQISLS